MFITLYSSSYLKYKYSTYTLLKYSIHIYLQSVNFNNLSLTCKPNSYGIFKNSLSSIGYYRYVTSQFSLYGKNSYSLFQSLIKVSIKNRATNNFSLLVAYTFQYIILVYHK